MCFTPAISLATAIIEFALAGVMFFVFKKSKLKNFLTVFIILLGLYQFSEFMLCSSSYSEFWAIFGFVVYSFLPAVGLHSALFFTKKWRSLFLLYVIPVAVSVFAIGFSNFIIVAQCDRVFVTIKTVLSPYSSFVFQGNQEEIRSTKIPSILIFMINNIIAKF